MSEERIVQIDEEIAVLRRRIDTRKNQLLVELGDSTSTPDIHDMEAQIHVLQDERAKLGKPEPQPRARTETPAKTAKKPAARKPATRKPTAKK